MSKILGTDTTMSALVKMADGNPGAANALVELVKLDGINSVMMLDRFGIYGSDIYILWSDICDRDAFKMHDVIERARMGELRHTLLKEACSRQDRTGKELIAEFL